MAACLCLVLFCVLAADVVGQGGAAGEVTFLVSPDGKLLAYPMPAYDEYAEEVTRVMVCGPAGEAPREVAVVPGHGVGVLWRGDDCLVASARDSLRYCAVTLDGERLDDLVMPEGCDVLYKRLSPDGRRVAFVGSYTPPGGEREGGLFVVDFGTGDVQRLVAEWLKTAPAWSPDSRRLAVSRAAGYLANHPLVVADVETGEVVETNAQGVGAAWSPDGRFLACVTEAVKGGSWCAGVPCDGRIGLVEVGPWTMTHLTPPGRNESDKQTGRWELEGTLEPLWCPDGQWLAYARQTLLRADKKADTEQSYEVWVVRRTGDDARKVLDGHPQLAWSADGAYLYALTPWEQKLVRVSMATQEVEALASWEEPQLPELPEVEPTAVERPGAIVRLMHIDEAYGQALAAILSEARRQYAEVLGFAMPDTVELDVTLNPRGRVRLWTDGESHAYLTISSKRQLAPPTQSGVFNIYGMCHELGHIAMHSQLDNAAGLPDGVGEGWAHYAGSVVVEEVSKVLGNDVWPQPYDIAAVEGLARLRREVEGKSWEDLSPMSRAAKVFYDIEVRYGRATVAAAMLAALGKASLGKDLMPLFVQALRDSTGDANAGDWIPESCLVPEVKWTAPREVDDAFFAALKSEVDETGVVLSYDDGTSDGRQSTALSGHAVLFRRPEGQWAVDRISLFGGRYGTVEPPEDDFWVYICDESFVPLADVARPYALFESRELQWYEIEVDPVTVPERFYACVAFNPTASKGVYVCYDESVEQSHSRSALPYSHVAEVRGKYDWMIRVHLVKQK